MASRVATLRLQLIDSVSGPSKSSTAALRGLEASINKLGKSGAPGAKRLAKDLEYLQQKSAAVGRFSELRRGLASTFGEFRQARSRVKELESALATVTKPTAKMRADLRSAQSVLKQTTAAFNEQRAAARNAEAGLRAFSVNSRSAVAKSQQQIRTEMAQTIRKMREMDREARKPKPKPAASSGGGSSGGGTTAGDVAGAVAGGAGARYGYQGTKKALMSGIDFDKAYRARDAHGNMTAENSAMLNAQAERIGQDTEFTNADVVNAQNAVIVKGIRDAGIVAQTTEIVTQYARAFGISMEQAAATVVGLAQTKGIDVKDGDALTKLVDRMAWASKNSGMQDDDVRQFSKYGGPSSRVAGLPDDYLTAAGMVYKRANLGGDEAGVAMRTIMGKLVAPTQKGRLALHAMGIDYNDYVTSPESFNAKGFEAMLKENFGLKMTEAVRNALAETWDSEFADAESGETLAVKSDRGEFTSRSMEALQPILGKMKPKDQEAVAGYIGRFHNMSAEAVDATKLLMDFLSKDVNLIRTNAMFTERQGARAAILAMNFEQYQKDIQTLQGTPGGIAKQIGDEKMQGIYGDWERMIGTFETAFIRIGQNFEGVTRPIITTIDSVVDGFLKLDKSSQNLITAFGLAATAIGGAFAFKKGVGIFGDLLGGRGKGARGVLSSGCECCCGGGGGDLPDKGKKGSKWGWATVGRFAGLASLLMLSGSSANNTYANADADERAKMREEAAKRAEAYNAANPDKQFGPWFKRLMLGAAAEPGFNFRQHMGVETGMKSREQQRISGDLASETAGWPAAAQQGIQGYIQALTAGGTEAQTKAALIGEQIKTELSVTGNPEVNTARLERALDLARQLAAVMRTELGGGGSTTATGGSVGGTRAGGGPVQAGKTYAVGGKGVELFTPGSNGHITPNHALRGGGVTVQQTNHITLGGGSGSDAERLAQTLDRQLRRSAETAFANLSYGDA